MISKTIGFRGLAYFQTHPYISAVYRLSGSDVGQAIHGSPQVTSGSSGLAAPTCQAKESQKASNETEEWSQRTQEPQEDPGTDLSM